MYKKTKQQLEQDYYDGSFKENGEQIVPNEAFGWAAPREYPLYETEINTIKAKHSV